jgi:phospholipid/cholesterol/gamma-HCH transport system substrate-binding protein
MIMKRNNDVFSEVIVGLFMVGVFALLAYFTIVISGVDLLRGREQVRITVDFKDVGRLKERDNVLYRGMRVGSVEHIDLASDKVSVVLSVDNNVVLRDTYKISVESQSLLGGNYLLLEEGSGEPLSLEATRFQGAQPNDWMRDLSEITGTLKKVLAEGEVKNIVSNVNEAVDRINKIAVRVESGQGTIGKLLSSDETLYNDLKVAVTEAKKMMVSGCETFDRVNEIASRLARGEGTLGKLFSSDDTIYRDMQSAISDFRVAVADAKSVAGKINAGDGLLGKLVNDKSLGEKAEKLLGNLEEVSGKLKRGEGTIGKLVADQELYNVVNALVKDIRQIVDNYRDTTPISTFGGLIMGGL